MQSYAFSLYLKLPLPLNGCQPGSFSSHISAYSWKRWIGCQEWRFWMSSKYVLPFTKVHWIPLFWVGILPAAEDNPGGIWSVVDCAFNPGRRVGAARYQWNRQLFGRWICLCSACFCQYHFLETYSMPYSLRDSYCFKELTYFTEMIWGNGVITPESTGLNMRNTHQPEVTGPTGRRTTQRKFQLSQLGNNSGIFYLNQMQIYATIFFPEPKRIFLGTKVKDRELFLMIHLNNWFVWLCTSCFRDFSPQMMTASTRRKYLQWSGSWHNQQAVFASSCH